MLEFNEPMSDLFSRNGFFGHASDGEVLLVADIFLNFQSEGGLRVYYRSKHRNSATKLFLWGI